MEIYKKFITPQFKKFVDMYTPVYKKKEYMKNAKMFPIWALVSEHMYDSEYVKTATIDPENEQSWSYKEMDAFMKATETNLHNSIQSAYISGVDATYIVYMLDSLDLFRSNQKNELGGGLIAYYENQYEYAMLMLVPLFEAILRNLISNNGGKTMRTNSKAGGEERMTLEQLIDKNQKIIPYKYGCYLKFLLCDPQGWNIRNSMLHGIDISFFFQMRYADRMLHAYLLLAYLASERRTKSEERRCKR